MKSKTYTLSVLLYHQRVMKDFNHENLSTFKGRLKPLFPVNRDFDKKKSNPWAFKCICGNFCVQDYSSVKRGASKSCGCLIKTKNKNKHMLYVMSSLLKDDSKLLLTKQGSNYKSRDWGFKCLDCGTEKQTLNSLEALTREKGFCSCNGAVFCKTREEAQSDLINKLKDTVWSLYSFPEQFTNKKTCRVDLLCKNCNYIHTNVLFGNAYRKGCPSCANRATSNRLKKDLAWFIEESNIKHNYKYNYSKSVYVRCRDKLEIICNYHKNPCHFWQSPDNHKNKGKGCPECKRLRLKHVCFHKSRVEENKEFYLSLPSGVYISKVGEVYKIGITCDLHKRHKEIEKGSNLNTNNIYYREMNLYDALMLEHTLHKKYEDIKYYFTYTWAGHSECFNLNVCEIKDTIKFIRDYNITEGGWYE